MSTEPTKPMEGTPVVEPNTVVPSADPVVAPTPAGETPAAPVATPADPIQPAATADSTTAASEGLKKHESLVTATPASEGVLGYKEPGFFKQFIYSKHFFWFGDDASSAETLTSYLRSEKPSVAHEHAAWAQETGKGLLFYAKRFEDKAAPAGLIPLYDASAVATEGTNEFSCKVGTHLHRFQASSAEERDSWVVAIKKKLEEVAPLKEEITGRESYKKNLADYAKPAAAAGVLKAPRSKSKEPNKSLDAATATNTATAPAAATPAVAGAAAAPAADNASSSSSSDEERKKAKKEKERSQSRKRQSIFGALRGKKDEHDVQKEVKKQEKEEVKQEKKLEAEQKKEEAKAEHDPSKAKDAAEAAALAAVPAAALAADKKADDKAEDKATDATATDKKAKRTSVFGTLFQKKAVTSPPTEKDADPLATTKEAETAPVAETAPQVPPPAGTAPIDAAAVTAPTGETALPPVVDEPAKDTTSAPVPATDSATSPKTEKKSFMSFMKKPEGKKEVKDETTKPLSTEPSAPLPTDVPATTEPSGAVTSPVTSPPADAGDKDKRRSSFFGFAGMKKKTAENPEAEEPVAQPPKRDRSPLPGALGGLSRKFSSAMKSDKPKKTTDATPAAGATPATGTTAAAATGTETATDIPATNPVDTPATTGVTEPTATGAAAGATPILPETPAHEATTIAPEVRSTA